MLILSLLSFSARIPPAARRGVHGILYHLPGTVKPREHEANGTNFTFCPLPLLAWSEVSC